MRKTMRIYLIRTVTAFVLISMIASYAAPIFAAEEAAETAPSQSGEQAPAPASDAVSPTPTADNLTTQPIDSLAPAPADPSTAALTAPTDQNLLDAKTAATDNNPPTTNSTPGVPEPTNPLFAVKEPAKFDVGANGKADVAQSTGAFNYNYTFDIPKGRNELQPSLQLSYNSQVSDLDSAFGYGWDMSMPAVTRIAKIGTTMNFASTTFSLSLAGVGEITPLAVDANGYGTYAALQENNFFKIEYLSTNVWKVTDKIGTVYTFGTTASQRRDDPSDATHVYQWMLQETRDTNDNFARYEYFKDSGQIYLSKIFYTGTGSTDGIYQINVEPFASGNLTTRADVHVSDRPGFTSTTNYIASRINVLVNGVAKGFYTLSYTPGSNAKKSLLASVTAGAVGAQGGESTMPPTNFTYQGADKVWVQDTSYTLPLGFEISGSQFSTTDNHQTEKFQVIDVNGDGLQDILFSFYDASTGVDTWYNRAYINNHNGQWIEDDVNYLAPFPFYTKSQSWPYWDRFKTFRVMDVNGDSLPDFVESYFINSPASIVNNVYLNNGVNGWTLAPQLKAPFVFAATTYGGWNSGVDTDFGPEFQTADVNGDGLDDFIVSYQWSGGGAGNVDQVYINNGVNGWTLDPAWTVPIRFGFLTNGAVTGSNAPYYRMFDVNGDGMVDIVFSYYIQSGDITTNNVYINNGKNGWNLDQNWHAPFQFAYLSMYGALTDSGPRFKVLDINGDGLQDFVYSWFWEGPPVDIEQHVYLNNGATGWDLDPNWTIPFYFAGTSGASAAADYNPQFRIADATGNGVVNYLWSAVVGPNNIIRLYKSNSIRSTDRMTAVSVNNANVLSVTYSTSALQRDASNNLLNPTLPQNVVVAKDITYNDGVGNTTVTNYTYRNGAMHVDADTNKNKFAGFAQVDRVLGNEKTTTYFHQGGGFNGSSLGENADSYNKIGKPYRSEVYDTATGVMKQQSITKWDEQSIGTTGIFVFASQQTNSDVTGAAASTASTYAYDFTNGNQLTEQNLGLVTADLGTGAILNQLTGDEKTSTNTFAVNATKHILAAPKNQTTTNATQTRLQNTYYDNLPLGSVDKVNVTKEEAGQNPIHVTRTFNSFGLPITETDPKSNTTQITYDAYNLFPATKSNAAGQTVQSTYNLLNGQPSQTIDITSTVSKNTFDDFGRLVKSEVTDPANPTGFVTVKEISYVNNVIPSYVEVKNYFEPTRYTIAREYFDALHRSIQKKRSTANSAEWATIDTSYNTNGRVSRESLPYITTSNTYSAADLIKPAKSYVYDSLGHVLTETTPTGTTQYTYNGMTVTVIDPNGNSKDITRDAYGNIATVVEKKNALTFTTQYTYTVSNKLSKIIDSQGNIRNFVYDDLDNLLSQDMVHKSTQGSPAQMTYTYDANGNVLTKADFNGVVTSYTYDPLNREINESNSTSTMTVWLGYDGTGGYQTGKLTGVSSGGTYTSGNTYDALGRVISEVRNIKNGTYTVGHEYNLAGNSTKTIYPDSVQVMTSYDNAGQAVSMTMNRGQGIEPLASNILYNAAGQMIHLERANGVITDYTYDPAKGNRLTRLLTKKNTTVLQDIAYTYDADGNILTLNDSSPTAIAKTANYIYDVLNRLTSAAITYHNVTGHNYTRTFSYDAVGNKTTDSSLGALVYGGNQPHQLLSVAGNAIVYDPSGNMTSYQNALYGWDWRNRMAWSRAAGTNLVSYYEYDEQNNRYLKYTVQRTQQYVFVLNGNGGGGTWQIQPVTTTIAEERYVGNLYEVDLQYQWKDHIFLGSQKLATLNNAYTLFFTISDHLGSASIMTDSAGAIAEATDYFPYGATSYEVTTTSTGNAYKFTGKEVDPESNLQYYGQRYYSDNLGRFNSIDPVMLSLSNAQLLKNLTGRDLNGILVDPQLLNSYSYARNNPVLNVDKQGNFIFLAPLIVWGVMYGVPLAITATAAIGAAIASAQLGQAVGYTMEGDIKSSNLMASAAINTELYTGAGASSLMLVQEDLEHLAGSRTTKAYSTQNFDDTKVEFKANKHVGDFQKYLQQDVSKDEYKNMVEDIWAGNGNILEKNRSQDGAILRYDVNKNIFSTRQQNGEFGTMYPPRDGLNYWFRQSNK